MARLRSLLLALLVTPAAAGARAQSLEVRPEQTRATLGDPITLRITVRLPPGMELIDAVPHPLVPPPRGIRVLSTDSLRRIGSGEMTGRAQVAFYRIGPQPVPTLALLYRSAPGSPPDTLVHMPVSVEITPILPAGSPPLRDIRPLAQIGGPVWAPLALLLGLVGAGFWWLKRQARLRDSAPRRLDVPVPPGPFELALARLVEIEQTARASGNGVVPLYADVSEVVRTCLVEVGALPHTGLTTREVGQLLPPDYAAGGLGAGCVTLLSDADLVKFAKVSPDLPAAERHLAGARALLESWRERESSGRAVEPPSRRAAG
jgi:hypothetical protein